MNSVWVVEDDLDMQQAVKLMLTMMGYSVHFHNNARSAAKHLLEGAVPDLILLDIMMPEVTGIDFLEFLRRRSDYKHIPVVMLSAESTDVQVDEAMSLGADGFVFKPVTFEELEGAIQGAFAAHGVDPHQLK
ncbi:MAG: response regulator [Anaerolineales bacterium]|nr:response regulator [Anaerolineales bacterium]